MQSILVVLFLLISGQQVTPPQQSVLHGSVRDEQRAVVWYPLVQATEVADDAGAPQNVPSSKKKGLTASAYTDNYGEYRMTLEPGLYKVCAVAEAFVRNCQNTHLESGKETVVDFVLTLDPVWKKEHGRADSEVMDQRLRALAGAAAIDCGHVQVKASPASATKCAIRAFRHGKPFVVQYDIAAIESGVAGGLASNDNGDVYGVLFDSMGMSDGDLKDGETMPDGSHTDVMPCPRPARIRVNKHGRATCFKKKSRNPLWILDEE